MWIDIHTHGSVDSQRADVLAVVTAESDSDLSVLRYCSLGIHPWNVTREWPAEFARLEEAVNRDRGGGRRVVAIGECGLDKLRGPEMGVQMACFEAQCNLAERMGLPIIIHCVKAWEELCALFAEKRQASSAKSQPSNFAACIIHGFRGKRQLAEQLLRQGFELSFGEKFNEESLQLAYKQRKMWLETDDAGISIEEVYEAAAKALSISPTEILLPGTITF